MRCGPAVPLLAALSLGACKPEPLPATGEQYTETFRSELLDDDFLLRIRLPPGVDESEAWPLVVHAQDGLGRGVQLRLDLDATWGIGSQMFLAAETALLAQLPNWEASAATGSLAFALRAAYDHEAPFLAPWVNPDQIDGVSHRLQIQVASGRRCT